MPSIKFHPKMFLQAVVGCGALISIVSAYDNGLAITPAMGWNTWNKYGCNINEKLIISTAETIKSEGLDKLGYVYVNIDDCWQAPHRGPNGEPLADPDKFPSGIKHLSDRIHQLGLKIGIYSDAGSYTCGKRYGSLGYESIDAKTYAEWGIDYLKYDNCYNEGLSGTPNLSATRYRTMRDALNSTGRPILYSLCQWGEDSVWNWGSTIANSWRISGDITDQFDRPDDRCPCQDSISPCTVAGYQCSVMNILEKAAPLGQKAASGGWNDLDMLEVGNGRMSYQEYITHFSMWALVKSPLILGNDITQMSSETRSIITNKEIIDLNQDSGYRAGYRVWKKPSPYSTQGSIQLWKAHLSNGAYALAFINGSPLNITSYSVSLLDFFNDEGDWPNDRVWEAQDLWNSDNRVTIPPLKQPKDNQILMRADSDHGDFQLNLNDIPGMGLRSSSLQSNVSHRSKRFTAYDVFGILTDIVTYSIILIYLFCILQVDIFFQVCFKLKRCLNLGRHRGIFI